MALASQAQANERKLFKLTGNLVSMCANDSFLFQIPTKVLSKHISPKPLERPLEPVAPERETIQPPKPLEKPPEPFAAEREAVQPLTLEQLNSLYYNQKLEQNGVYIENFIQVSMET